MRRSPRPSSPDTVPDAIESDSDRSPDVEFDRNPDMELGRPVDPRTIPVWRWTALLASAAPFVAITFLTVVMTIVQSPAAIAFWIAWPLLLVLIAIVTWWYPRARYCHLGYRIEDAGITIRNGVFWRKQSSLPRRRIQHTDVSQGPLQRRYGVATLKLYTAGSRYTRTELPGLEHGEAVELRDRLQREADDDAV